MFNSKFSFFFTLTLMAATLIFATAATPSFAQSSETTDQTISKLVDVLKDDAARNKLIGELENAIVKPDEEDVVAPIPQPKISLGRRVAIFTQSAVEGTASRATDLWNNLSLTGNVFSGLKGDEIAVLWAAIPGLLLVIVITIAVFLALRFVAIPFYRKIGARATNVGPFKTTFLFVGSNLFDALIVVAAWAIGYAVTLLALGEFGTIGIRQTMYLNAFLLVELLNVIVRMVLSPNASGLRIVPLGDFPAQKLTKYARVVVGVLGYGQLLIVPIVNQSTSYSAGNGVTALLSVFVLLYLIFIVVRRRADVAAWIVSKFDPKTIALSEHQQLDADDATLIAQVEIEKSQKVSGLRAFLMNLAQNWHWFALLYLAGMFEIVMTQSAETIFGALLSSGKILVAIIAASLVSSFLARSIANGITLPGDINQKLPLLQPRINGAMSKALGFIRFLVITFVVLFILDIIGAIDMRGGLESQVGLHMTSTLASLGLIMFGAFSIWLAFTSWVDFRLNPEYGNVPTAREATLLTLFRNAATIALVILTLMFCLSEIGLDIGPLLASAGVLGLAIGFGAQKMVQDIITGVFIQFENAINVGDVITVGGTNGTVEKLSVRSVSLRDVHGIFHIIPFSSVDMVSNFSRDFAYFVCDMGVAYRENVEDVKIAMHDCFDELRADPEQRVLILKDLEWFGVNTFGDSAVVVRARIKTVPGKQFGVGRAYNSILKRVFDERNIEIPFPHQTIFFGEAKDGTRQSIKLENEG